MIMRRKLVFLEGMLKKLMMGAGIHHHETLHIRCVRLPNNEDLLVQHPRDLSVVTVVEVVRTEEPLVCHTFLEIAIVLVVFPETQGPDMIMIPQPRGRQNLKRIRSLVPVNNL
jgi:hypothetical protein